MDGATSTATLPAYSIEVGSAPCVERVEWLGEGDYCRCFLVNNSYVFRFAKHAAASAAMLVERCLLPVLREALRVAVPEVRFAGHCTATGEGLLGYSLLRGAVLEADVLAQLPFANQQTLIEQIAVAVRELHTLPLQRVGDCALPRLHPLTHLAQVMQRARARLWPLLPAPVPGHHEALLAEYLGELALHTYQPALLHGDLSPDHFLADTQQGQLTGMIDFGDACIGDPAWDLIYIFEDYGPQVLAALLEQYDPSNAALLTRKVQIYQQLNNVAYALAMLAQGNAEEQQEALALLEEQAGQS